MPPPPFHVRAVASPSRPSARFPPPPRAPRFARSSPRSPAPRVRAHRGDVAERSQPSSSPGHRAVPVHPRVASGASFPKPVEDRVGGFRQSPARLPNVSATAHPSHNLPSPLACGGGSLTFFFPSPHPRAPRTDRPSPPRSTRRPPQIPPSASRSSSPCPPPFPRSRTRTGPSPTASWAAPPRRGARLPFSRTLPISIRPPSIARVSPSPPDPSRAPSRR